MANGTSVNRVSEKVRKEITPGDLRLEAFRNKIICGDAVQIMKKIPSNSIGLIVTSPPYNLKNSTGNGMKDGRGGKWSSAALINGYIDHADNMPHEDYVEWQG